MKILVTGTAGFIGSAVSLKLLERGHKVLGIDNVNDYYDANLKESRLRRLLKNENFKEARFSIEDRAATTDAFRGFRPDRVIHLAAQAGVRFSISNPFAYIDSNVTGFLSILEACRHNSVEHLVYASSSSVYGSNTRMPFSVHHNVDHPVSLYAATKKANELMAHSYSHLYDIPTTGLRFFTVYGPWGRPDMALFKFTRRILENKPIHVFNFGNHKRDFTFIDDIVDGLLGVLEQPPTPNPDWPSTSPDPATSSAPYRLYNIGGNRPVELMHCIRVLEKCLGRQAQLIMEPLQSGDVLETNADIDALVEATGYRPRTTIEEGIPKFVDWYQSYYNS